MLLVKLIVSKLVKKLSVFYGPLNFVRVLDDPHFNIIISCERRSPKCYNFLVFQLNYVRISCIPVRAKYPSYIKIF